MTVVIEKSVVALPGIPLRTPLEVPAGISIRDLLRRGDALADGGRYLLPAVNGESTNLDRTLRDGDRISIFRLSAGG